MKAWFLHLSLAQKLITVLLLAGLVPLVAVSIISLSVASNQLEAKAFDELHAVRQIKASAVERYFDVTRKQIVSMAENPQVVNAAGAFTRSFPRVMDSDNITPDDLQGYRQQLASYYNGDFAARFSEINDGTKVDANALLNALDDQAVAMQYLYIADNSNPLGEKHLLDTREGRSVYHKVHQKYHDGFRKFINAFGFYDLFIVDVNSGDIVYSVFKELDYATSLIDGPYADTNFGETFRRSLKLKEGQTIVQDYALYAPSYNAPASFIGTPIFYNDKMTAVLILQMPLEPINVIMGERSGMGDGGESYLVGGDKLMRSDSYLRPKTHSVFASFNHPDRGSVDTEAVRNAFQDQAGEKILRDYTGNKVLSSFSKIDLGDFSWAVIAELDKSEAFSGVTLLKWSMFAIAVLGALGIAGFAVRISNVISKPILDLGNTIQRVGREGNFHLQLDNRHNDEIGQTSRAFNSLLNNLNSSISETNSVLSALAAGNLDQQVSENYPGQLGTLTHGVNVAVTQIQSARKEQQLQQQRAESSAEAAQAAADRAQAQATETLIIKQALDVSATSVMIADAEFNIIYMNHSATALMRSREGEISRELPAFKAASLVGSNIDIFHKNPAHQRRMLQELRDSFKARLDIASLNFNLSATPIRDGSGKFLGAVVEWEDITEQLAKALEDQKIADENARIRQALDSSSTGTMIADVDFNIIYMNSALDDLMQNAQADLRKQFGHFDATQLRGQNMDVFHRNPQHQRSLMTNLTSTHQAEISAGGRTLSLTASPIINTKGKRIGTVMEWLDRTAEVAIEKEIDAIITAAASGDFSQVLDTTDKDGFFLSVSRGLNRVMETTNIALQDIMRIFAALAQGDLSQKIQREYQGEFARLKVDANTTVEKLQDIIERISTASANIARGSAEISSGNADLSQRTEEQASSLEETASSMEEMTTIVKQSEDNAREARELALRSVTIAREGNASVQATTKAMAEISAASSRIANIIGVIDEIAFQTNLLALNAAVEAARAGEQGRGFAVVAGEVRNLAQRSATAAREIKNLINDSVTKVEGGSTLVETSGKTLQSIVIEIEKVGTMMEALFDSAREQTAGIQQVNTAVSQMDQMTQQNAALVEEASATSESMAELAHQLDQMVAFFKR